MTETIDTRTIELGKVKGIFLLADGKQVYSFTPEKGATVKVKMEVTQITK